MIYLLAPDAPKLTAKLEPIPVDAVIAIAVLNLYDCSLALQLAPQSFDRVTPLEPTQLREIVIMPDDLGVPIHVAPPYSYKGLMRAAQGLEP
jgi:hypothetical protein